MNFKIQKGIPMPIPDNRGRPGIYPFKEMKAGDSFWVEGGRNKLSSVKGSAVSWAKRRGIKAEFTIRKEGKGVRLWRVK